MKFRFPSSVTFFILFSGLTLDAGLAQKKRPEKPEIQTYSEKEEAPKEPERFAPVLKAADLAPKRKLLAEEKLAAAIETIKTLIETTHDLNDRSEFLTRLAEMYWDKAESYFNKAYGDEMFKALAAAQDRNDEAEVKRLTEKQQEYLILRQKWQEEAVNVYRMVIDTNPQYKHVDSVLYYLGFTLTLMQRPDDGYQYFVRILRETPDSPYIPDALLNIAEYFFNKDMFDDALKIYQQVENFPQSGAYGLALYKKGWCYYNKQSHDLAMDAFLKVIKYSESEEAKKIPYGHTLRSEAIRDLIMVYLIRGSVDKAIPFFKSVSPDNYMELAVKLAEGYSNNGLFENSIRMYKHIIKEAPDSHRILTYQREILDNTYKIGIKSKVVEETRRLVKLLAKLRASAPQDYLKKEEAAVEETIRVIATTYHKEVEVTKEEATVEFVIYLYDEYLKLWPESPEAYKINLNYALMLDQIGKHEEAARAYENLIALNPQGEFTKQAAHAVVVSYYKKIDLSKKIVKGEYTEKTEPIEIPADEMKMVAACDRYIAMAESGDPDVPEAKFVVGKIYYEYNHFDRSVELFKDFIERYPDHPNSTDAARLLLSAFHLKRDIKELNHWADIISRNPKLNRGDIEVLTTKIKDQAEFNKCFEYEKEGKHEQAGECFLGYVQKFPGTELLERALFNAANNFFKAKLVEKALKANEELYNRAPHSPLGQKALFNIAEIYRRLAVYSHAAHFYEIFVQNHPKHELTEEALRYATIFRRGLGEHKEAIKNLNLYVKLFPRSQYTPNVFYEIGVVYEKDGRLKEALAQYLKYMQTYKNTGGIDLFFKVQLSIAKLYQRLGSKKEAQATFQKIVDTYNSLSPEEKEKISPSGLSCVAEAKFNIGEKILADAHNIKLKLPEKVLAELLAKKVKLLISAVEIFNTIQEFGQPKWTIAAHSRIGFGFQQLATDIEKAPIPKHIPIEAQEIQRQELAKQAQPYWQRAGDEYKKCITIAQQLKWFNEYSERAEEELTKIDPEFKPMGDIKVKPEYYSLNVVKPPFMPENEETESPFNWGQPDLENRLKEQTAHKKPSAVDFYNLGLYYEFTGKLREADAEYKKALSIDPQFHQAVAGLGVVAFKGGNTDGALAQFNRALEIDSTNATARNYLAYLSFSERKFPDAVSHVRLALVSDPDNMNAYLNLIAVYYEMGLYDLALLVVRNALAINPKEAAVYNLTGLIYLKLGDVFSAVKNFLKAIEYDPVYTDPHLNLGAITLNYKDYKTASEHLNAVKDRNLLAKLSLGVAERGLGRVDSAKATYEEIIREKPNYPDVHYNMCLLYLESMSDYKSAKDECLKFLNKAPAGHPKLGDAQKRLNDIEVLLGASGE